MKDTRGPFSWKTQELDRGLWVSDDSSFVCFELFPSHASSSNKAPEPLSLNLPNPWCHGGLLQDCLWQAKPCAGSGTLGLHVLFRVTKRIQENTVVKTQLPCSTRWWQSQQWQRTYRPLPVFGRAETVAGRTVCPWAGPIFMLHFFAWKIKGLRSLVPVVCLSELQKSHDFSDLTENSRVCFQVIFQIQVLWVAALNLQGEEFSIYFWLTTYYMMAHSSFKHISFNLHNNPLVLTSAAHIHNNPLSHFTGNKTEAQAFYSW